MSVQEYVSLPFGILERGGSDNDPLCELRKAGIGACPECGSKWSTDLKRSLPIQEICGHIKCRQCFIKAMDGDEDNCYQCDQGGKRMKGKNQKIQSSLRQKSPSNLRSSTRAKSPRKNFPDPMNVLPTKNLPLLKVPKKERKSVDEQTQSNNTVQSPNFRASSNKVQIMSTESPTDDEGVNFKEKKLLQLPNEIPSEDPLTSRGISPTSLVNFRKRKRQRFSLPDFIIEKGQDPVLFHCTKCKKSFKTKAHIKYHEFCDDPKGKPFVCTICDNSFIAKSHYEYHQRLHTGERPYKCPTCGKGFNQKGKVTRHLKSHTGEKPFVCLVCGKGFANNQALSAHTLIHTGEKPYICSHCGKGFTGQTNLKKHLIVHTGERPFPCPECGKCFGLKWTLDLHLRTHSTDKPFTCDECNRGFSNQKDLRRHKVIHTGLRPFQCTICETAFRRKDNLERHIRMTHNRTKPDSVMLSNESAANAINADKKDAGGIKADNKAFDTISRTTIEDISVIADTKSSFKVSRSPTKKSPTFPTDSIPGPSLKAETTSKRTSSVKKVPVFEFIPKFENEPTSSITVIQPQIINFQDDSTTSSLEELSRENTDEVKIEVEVPTSPSDDDPLENFEASDTSELSKNEEGTTSLCAESLEILLRLPEEDMKLKAPDHTTSMWEIGTPPEENTAVTEVMSIKTEVCSEKNVFDIMDEEDDFMRF